MTLPFQRSSYGKFSQYYLGRYIFIDGKLKGVRLATSEDNKYTDYPSSNLMRWPKKLLEWVPIPTELAAPTSQYNAASQ